MILVFKTRNLVYYKIFPQKSDSEPNQLEWIEKPDKVPSSTDDNVNDNDSISTKKILGYSANYKSVISSDQFLEMFYSAILR